jgi:hypothetical protein
MAEGLPPFEFAGPSESLAPDQEMWQVHSASALDPDAANGETLQRPATAPQAPPAPPVQPQAQIELPAASEQPEDPTP